MNKQLFIFILIVPFFFLSERCYSQTVAQTSITSPTQQKEIKQVISREAKEYYMIGARNLKSGQEALKKATNALNNAFNVNRISIVTLRNLFKEERIPIADFFIQLEKKYKYAEFLRIYNIFRQQVANNLQTANESFNKAIKNSQGFVDAYLLKTLACLEMCWYEEAISAFEQALKIGLDRLIIINPLEEEFEKACFGLAHISLTKPNLFKDKQIPPDMIIKKFMELREAKLKKIEGDTFDDEKLIQIANQLLLNRFELAKFYWLNFKKAEAIAEFEKVYNEELRQILVYETEKYAQANREIEILESNIKNLRGEVTLYFEQDKQLVDTFQSKVNLKFFKETTSPTTVDDLFIYLMPTRYEVEIKNEGVYQNVGAERLRLKLPHGVHTCLMELPKLEIIETNRIPLGITIENKERKYYERLFPQMEFKIALGEGRFQTINLNQGEYQWDKQGSLINKATGELYRLKRGPFSAKLVISKLELFAGEGEYGLKIEKVGQWEVKVGKEASSTFSKYSLGLMGVLFLALR